MSKKILLTSFDTWLPHQPSNSSDDLLNEVTNSISSNLPLISSLSLNLLRQLPVDIEQASRLVIARINQLNPDIIICCGMAERRQRLTVESRATSENRVIETWVDIQPLIANLNLTDISHDAGKFVCEGLYYSTLSYLQEQNLNSRCIFVHVPPLTLENLTYIKADFFAIISRISSYPSQDSAPYCSVNENVRA